MSTAAKPFTPTHAVMTMINGGTCLAPCVVVKRQRATEERGARVIVQLANGEQITTIPQYVTRKA